MIYLPELGKHPDRFPPLTQATQDGLLAWGGDLSCARLYAAYQRGIFPWYSEGEPLLWWSPDPRMVLYPEQLHISRSLKKILSQGKFRITLNHAFAQVMSACAEIPRQGQAGTWITQEMQAAYQALHQQGAALSVEAWQQDRLVGGAYGVVVGKAFFGESMFARTSNASKVAFVYLVHYLAAQGCPLLDCQVYSAHLASLGAELVSRQVFSQQLKNAVNTQDRIACEPLELS